MRAVFLSAPDNQRFVEKRGISVAVTESINYTAARMAQVWPNPFRVGGPPCNPRLAPRGLADEAFFDIYGERMGQDLVLAP